MQRFEGALSATEEDVIGIVVARDKKRLTKQAVPRAKESAGYNIILMDECHLYPDLIKYIKSNRLDGSNKSLKKELEETRLEVQQLRSEIAELKHLIESKKKKRKVKLSIRKRIE